MKIRERCGQVARSIKANKQKRTGEKKKGREGKKKVSLDEECNRQEIKKEKKIDWLLPRGVKRRTGGVNEAAR